MGPVIVSDAKGKVREIDSITDVQISPVFEPPWNRNKMSEEAKLELGLF